MKKKTKQIQTDAQEMVKDLLRMVDIIIQSDKLTMALEDKELQKYYKEELLTTINAYYIMEDLLQMTCKEEYDTFITKHGGRLDFIFKRLERELV